MASEKKKIKVLAYCDAPSVATGFGTVSRNVLLGLHNTGDYEIEVLGINHHGNPHPFEGIFKIWPVLANSGGRDPYGRDWVKKMLMSMDYDILFTIQDSFILEFLRDVIDGIRNRNPKMRWINYFPVDGVPKSSWLEVMARADFSFTYTEWGRKLCCEVYPQITDRLGVIPHGVNTRDFYPLPKPKREGFRRDYFGPHSGKFIVLNVNRNQQRKDIPRSMRAFKRFNVRYPNSVYYIHAAVEDHGWNLFDVANSVGLTVNENICFPADFNPNQGYPVGIVNALYNACDVVLSSTLGEGWGLAQTEAMACCKPVVSPDNTSCSEILSEDRGILVRSGWCDDAFTILPHDNEVVRPLANIEDMVSALSSLYEDAGLRSRVAINGYKWVTSNLRWSKDIVPIWEKVFRDAFASSESSSLVGSGLSLVEL